MSQTVDAVVVGAGPNGLVAANALTDAGWSVLVLEQQPEPGGAVRSDEAVRPGWVHDTFSSYYPLAAASAVITGLRLEEHGLRWRRAPAVLGHPRPDGSWAVLHPDREVTAAGMDAQHPGDGDRWLELCRQWDAVGDELVQALTTPFPPLRHGLGVLARLPRAGGLPFVRTLLTPAVDLAGGFGGEGPGLLLAGNAAHADIPLDAAGSGLMGLLLVMLGQTVGFPVPEGGAGQLTRALVRRLEAGGGELRCSTRVSRVEVRRGRAVAVRTEHGERIAVTRAVLADVVAPALYGDLLAPEDVPARTARAMRQFQLDHATIKVDWALDGPVPWRSAPPYAPGTVHVADSLSEMRRSLGQLADGTVPADPFLLVGQTTTADPTRSPAGTEALWAYTHVPQPSARTADAGADRGEPRVHGRWDRDDCERFADRMQARLERLAPGFGDRVLDRRVLGPRELEARDANLRGGAINGGTAQLHQQLVFRPVPGWGRASTPVQGLFLASASAHPGGGVHGAPGMNAARGALAAARTGRLPRLPVAAPSPRQVHRPDS
ncbi:FAD-dependent oxidoreductase [Auraticoccus sp. F435]|uniref:Pyridine nucleotide-disulfide oxidoreductase domain-containing protein 2 n=1 Tax=Auraticoccus cholistanensis TaxID=2656650 RepID=A0A6A9UVY9_9ACTN|nr:FAD-dependent oxidoreductase [Auraticoccus cholistanensis]